MNDQVDTIILHQELAYADSLPMRVVALAAPPNAQTTAICMDRNLRLLQTCAALEEHAQAEANDDAAPWSADLQRLDLKVNLLLEMVGVLVANLQSRPPARPLRFNTQGLLWEICGDRIAPEGTPVQAEIFLRDSVMQPLVLTGVMQGTGIDTLASARLDELPETVADHIKKLVFRRHRRQIAVARATRR